ncbi:Transcriptional regulator MET32 [Colletotrichum orbiculare MAFF 240422]|uniref:Transcriptional regulator MET32 n=1 Tax=Colletotrichum orbiculare (strain 104-T / ATCC 96160 / CBS 514.97 / LARS 414 / MAFF 240422) TaxID=1213857 RepID=A0A484FNI9_COLOR|nr:Transcriptional regulator MET32 [Colletotrichum orbiculare MAFF 240422]
MAESSVGRGYSCATCGKQYQRSTHLRRHEATHHQSANHKCPYCDKAFARRDVCRKHALHCPSKPSNESVPNLKRGQKPRACDACFHSKQSCDTSDPCERCVARKLSCTYRRLDEGSESSVPSSAVETPTNSDDKDKDRTKITVAFLLGLTNPNSENILEFLASEAAARTEGDGLDPNVRPDTSSQLMSNNMSMSMSTDQDFAAWLPFPFVAGFVPESIDYFYSMTEPSTAPVSILPSPFDPKELENRVTVIVSELNQLHINLATSDPWYDGQFDLTTALSVLSPENLCAWAATFFRVSHIDFPIVHRPDFGTGRTTRPLLLVVGISGAIRSPPSDDVLAARGFLGLVEEYIFRALQRLLPHDSTPEYTHELEESMQAALMIHSVQFFRNDTATRRKNRTQRLPVLVSAMRCLGLAQTRHTPLFQYESFVRNESRIRLATWLALADWQQSGMFNVPSMITPSEMTCGLPCPLELWDSKDASEYFELAQRHDLNPARRIVSVKHCIDALMSDHFNGMGNFPFQDVNGSDLQILIFGINSMVLSSNLMGVLPSCQHSILRAVSRWESMWEAVRGRMDPAVLEKSGMVRYNTELGWAARQIIKVAISGDRSSAYMQKVGHDSLVELHEFVRQYRDV